MGKAAYYVEKHTQNISIILKSILFFRGMYEKHYLIQA